METLDYTSGPISQVNDYGYLGPLPSLGADLTGVITLSSPLPADGTTTVTPLSAEFGYGSQSFSAVCCSLSITTQGGQVTAFSMDQTQAPTSSMGGGIWGTQNGVEYVTGAPDGDFQAYAQGGTMVDPPGPLPAPEISLPGAMSALVFLAGVLAVLCERHRSHPAA